MIAFDPTTLLSRPSDAVTTAGALLHMPRPGPDCDSIWTSVPEAPLAALLYAASPRGNGKGIEWVLRAVDNLEIDDKHPDAPGWPSAARDLGAQPLFRDALLRTLEMNARQRDSIAITIRDALWPWMRPRRESTGE